jgi:hypothetical protein
MAAEVEPRTASNVPRLHAASALHSLKKAHARPTATLIQAQAVQRHVRHTVATIAHLAVTVRHTVAKTQVAQIAQAMVVVAMSAQLAMARTRVLMVVTGRLKATTVGFREAAQLASAEMRALAAQRSVHGETQPIAIHAQAMVAMIGRVATAGLREAAKLASETVSVMTAVASAHTASVQSALHTVAKTAHLVANGQMKSQLVPVVKNAQATVAMIALVSKTVRPSAAGAATQTTAASTAMTVNHATLIVQTALSVTLHARPLSVVHAMLTQTRRHSSKTRCLSA